MLELYIDSKPIILDKKIKITLVNENTSMTNSGNYTYDIEIPLVGNTFNSHTLNNIDRIDVGYIEKSYCAKIILNNKRIIEGTATILSSSNTSVTIQILEGNAESNFTQNLNSIYINEIETEVVDESTLRNISYFDQYNYDELREIMYGTYVKGEKNFVLYPIQGSSNIIRNDFKIKTRNVADHWIEISDNVVNNYKNLAPQPYLCFVIERVIEAAGYTLINNCLLDTPLKNLFVANAKNTCKLGAMLPAWTVLEFFKNIEQFAGVAFIINEIDKTISIIKRNENLLINTNYIKDIISDIEKEINVDDYSDISVANIGYDQDFSDDYIKVDSTIINAAVKKEGFTLESAGAFIQALEEEEIQNYLFIIGNAQYLYNAEKGQIEEINQMRDLIQRDSDEVDIKLQIVPVNLIEGTFVNDHYVSDRDAIPTKKNFPFVLMETGESDESINGAFNIAEAINGDIDVEDSYPDKIEVAFNDGTDSTLINNANFFGARLPHTLYKDPINAVSWRDYSLELNPISGRTTLFNIAYEAQKEIDKRTKYTLYFQSDKIISPTDTFIIHNKKYACESIEYTLTSTGVEKIVKGVFYLMSTF